MRDHLQRRARGRCRCSRSAGSRGAGTGGWPATARSSVRAAESEFQRSSIRASRSRRSAPAWSQSSSAGSRIKTLAEVLAGAEDLEQDLGRPGVVGELAEGRLGLRARGDEPLQVGQRHARVGAARQNRVELDGEPGDQVEAARPRLLGQVREVAAAALRVANAQPDQPVLEQLGDRRDRSGTSRRSCAEPPGPSRGDEHVRARGERASDRATDHGRRQIGSDVLEVAEEQLDVAVAEPQGLRRSRARRPGTCMSGRSRSANGRSRSGRAGWGV